MHSKAWTWLYDYLYEVKHDPVDDWLDECKIEQVQRIIKVL